MTFELLDDVMLYIWTWACVFVSGSAVGGLSDWTVCSVQSGFSRAGPWSRPVPAAQRPGLKRARCASSCPDCLIVFLFASWNRLLSPPVRERSPPARKRRLVPEWPRLGSSMQTSSSLPQNPAAVAEQSVHYVSVRWVPEGAGGHRARALHITWANCGGVTHLRSWVSHSYHSYNQMQTSLDTFPFISYGQSVLTSKSQCVWGFYDLLDL